MLYQQAYVWVIFLAALDVMLTWLILTRQGIEVNPVAHMVISDWGMEGATAFKFALVMLALVICEVVGRRRPVTGLLLSVGAALINALPVGWSLTLIITNWQIFAAPGNPL